MSSIYESPVIAEMASIHPELKSLFTQAFTGLMGSVPVVGPRPVGKAIDGDFLSLLNTCKGALEMSETKCEELISQYSVATPSEETVIKTTLSSKLQEFVSNRQAMAELHSRIICDFINTAPSSDGPGIDEKKVDNNLILMTRKTGERFGVRSLLLDTSSGFYKVVDIFTWYPTALMSGKELLYFLSDIGEGKPRNICDDAYTVSELPSGAGAGFELNGLKITVYNHLGRLVYMTKNGALARDSKQVKLLLSLLVSHDIGKHAELSIAARKHRVARAMDPIDAMEKLLLELTSYGTSYKFVVMDPSTTFNSGCYDLRNGSTAVLLGTSRNHTFTVPSKTCLFETMEGLTEKGLLDAANSFVLSARCTSGDVIPVKVTDVEHDLGYQLTRNCNSDEAWETRMGLVAFGCADDFTTPVEKAFMSTGSPAERLERFIRLANPYFHSSLQDVKARVLSLQGGEKHVKLAEFVQSAFGALRAKDSELYKLISKTGPAGKQFLDTVAKAPDAKKAKKFFSELTATIQNKPGVEFQKRNKKSLLAKFVKVFEAIPCDNVASC
jgi:hypothetical protein